MANDALSTYQMTAILDNVPVAVFVSGVESRKLLYANRLARETFPEIECPGASCYTVAGFEAPCPFCRAGKMNRTELAVREYRHPITHRIYQLSGKLIDWAGREAHIEYILDVTEKRREEQRLKESEQELMDTFDHISCGLCIYQVEGESISPIFHNRAFYDVMGYDRVHIRSVQQETTFLNVHPEDLAPLKEKMSSLLKNGGLQRDTYRLWNDREREYRWVHLEATLWTDGDGRTRLYGVYSDVSEQKRLERELTAANERMDHLVNSIPGGIASYRVEEGRFVPIFVSDGVPTLSGHTRKEYLELAGEDAMGMVCGLDRGRVVEACATALDSGAVLDVSYRVRHKNGNLVWVHLNGRRMGLPSEPPRFYAVFTNLLADVGTLTSEMADGIYIINKDNYDLLYISETKRLALNGEACVGKTCYAALHGLSAPCESCTLKTFGPDGQEHRVKVEGTDMIYTARVKEMIWNGIPAYIQYIRDVTEEIQARREKDRLEQYFQTLIRNLPGGVSVIHRAPDGGVTPEYISEGFAAMLQITVEECEKLYRENAFGGVHPDDIAANRQAFQDLVHSGEEHCELTARFRRGDGSYLWVRIHVSVSEEPDGARRIYSIYTDINQLMEEKAQLRRQYEEQILQHYRMPGPNTLILGHCNVTRNRILEILDSTESGFLDTFTRNRTSFFTGLSTLIVDGEERRTFLNTFLNEPTLTAFARKETEKVQICFVKMPRDVYGRYVKFKVNLLETPDTGDVTGILSVTDVTDKTISKQILRQLSVRIHDYVVDLDLFHDTYTVLSSSESACRVPPSTGRYTEWTAFMADEVVVPRDRAAYVKALSPEEIERRLRESGIYTFAYSLKDEIGDIQVKNSTVSAIDLRLGRVSLVCTDITASVREQQGLLSMLAYTFEMATIIHVKSNGMVLYTRRSVLENLPPYVNSDYCGASESFVNTYVTEDRAEARGQFQLQTVLRRLEKSPGGYEFILSCKGENGARYKQINVLWGDRNQETVCMVQADVTEMLTAERQTKTMLEKALTSAEEANRAKSDFLSAMSHDIRTPMNAIMGMTTLAPAHLEDREWMEDYLRKISISSKHLLSLINDVLDMSRIERTQIPLNRVPFSVAELVGHLSVMIEPQAREAGLRFTSRMEDIAHPAVCGDTLRLNQILINLLGNAVKFTPAGGQVEFLAQEIPPVESADHVRLRFTVSDTGVGMSADFLEKMFDPFTRDYAATRVEGTGLGLSIAHGLVELMGGNISVESREGCGSTFRVELEFEADRDESGPVAQDADGPREGGERSRFTGRRFLVAEDNTLNAEILCEILTMQGAQPVVARDGEQALRMFREAETGSVDAILMDIQMPVMDGYEATRAIRALDRPDAGTVPIIALTANAFAEDIQTALDAGMTAHVAKPIDVDVLWMTLRKVLEQ